MNTSRKPDNACVVRRFVDSNHVVHMLALCMAKTENGVELYYLDSLVRPGNGKRIETPFHDKLKEHFYTRDSGMRRFEQVSEELEAQGFMLDKESESFQRSLASILGALERPAGMMASDYLAQQSDMSGHSLVKVYAGVRAYMVVAPIKPTVGRTIEHNPVEVSFWDATYLEAMPFSGDRGLLSKLTKDLNGSLTGYTVFEVFLQGQEMVVTDLLRLRGVNYQKRPYDKRRQMLEALVKHYGWTIPLAPLCTSPERDMELLAASRSALRPALYDKSADTLVDSTAVSSWDVEVRKKRMQLLDLENDTTIGVRNPLDTYLPRSDVYRVAGLRSNGVNATRPPIVF